MFLRRSRAASPHHPARRFLLGSGGSDSATTRKGKTSTGKRCEVTALQPVGETLTVGMQSNLFLDWAFFFPGLPLKLNGFHLGFRSSSRRLLPLLGDQGFPGLKEGTGGRDVSS